MPRLVTSADKPGWHLAVSEPAAYTGHSAAAGARTASPAATPVCWLAVTRGPAGWVLQPFMPEAIAPEPFGSAGTRGAALGRTPGIADPDSAVAPLLLRPAAALPGRHLRSRTADRSLVSDILDLLGEREPERSHGEPAPLREPLSHSEARVLCYLPTNLSAPEIAAELCVSVNTIRTHQRHLYAKLGAHRRSQAVEEARLLGLLAPTARKG